MVEAIKDITAEELAEKIVRGGPLTRLEKNALIALLLDYARQRRRRIAGGKNPEAAGGLAQKIQALRLCISASGGQE